MFRVDVCRDKLDSCDKLADSGVCETSKDAMIMNCPETCNFCGMYIHIHNIYIRKKDHEIFKVKRIVKKGNVAETFVIKTRGVGLVGYKSTMDFNFVKK